MSDGPPPLDHNETMELVTLVGALTIRWSQIEGTWYMVFLTLYGRETRASVHIPRLNALYNSHRSASGARQMTFNYAKAILEESDPLFLELGPLYETTNKLSGLRNAVQHAHFVPVGTAISGRLTISPTSPPNKHIPDRDVATAIKDLLPKLDQLQIGLNKWMLRLAGHHASVPASWSKSP
jgi:hypothetical protein